ncbi:MAG: lysoplasmalogenase [Maribacter sp.]|uniref:lysoplasmalogenase n=1 Tax=Maribacter sp. TaxID=1897614 RepID=UPI003C7104EE
MKTLKLWFVVLLTSQFIGAAIAWATDIFIFKISVAALGTVILLIAYAHKLPKALDVWVVIIAFVCSMIGDYFLSHMHGDTTFFILGISLYLLAHIGYLTFSLLNGTLRWKSSIALTVVFLIFFYLALYPTLDDKTLAFMVLFYLIVSCVSLGAALGLKLEPTIKWPYVIGIALILFSDTIISFTEFIHYDALNFLILPTYYLAQIGITIALYLKRTEAKALPEN